jgi:hypothetical protein
MSFDRFIDGNLASRSSMEGDSSGGSSASMMTLEEAGFTTEGAGAPAFLLKHRSMEWVALMTATAGS